MMNGTFPGEFPVVDMRHVHAVDAWIAYMSMHVSPEDMIDVFDVLEDAFALHGGRRFFPETQSTQCTYRLHFGVIRCVF